MFIHMWTQTLFGFLKGNLLLLDLLFLQRDTSTLDSFREIGIWKCVWGWYECHNDQCVL